MHHERWMEFALREAETAYEKDEIPVGAVVIYENQIIGRGHNLVETLQDPTAHAEIIALTASANYLNSRRLSGCSLYVTLEPCTMCAGAIVLSRIDNLIYGAFDPKTGACGTLYDVVRDERLNHQVDVVSGVLEHKSSAILTSFFRQLR